MATNYETIRTSFFEKSEFEKALSQAVADRDISNDQAEYFQLMFEKAEKGNYVSNIVNHPALENSAINALCERLIAIKTRKRKFANKK